MNIALLLISAAVVLLGMGGYYTFVSVRNAPVGFEDAEGFHPVSTPEYLVEDSEGVEAARASALL
ncbi:MAG: hypothetical protein HZC55_04780 [Verrucomicrobia bacterium]|nr:hypothetical protein [Verrucomicrobiota bacterium]